MSSSSKDDPDPVAQLDPLAATESTVEMVTQAKMEPLALMVETEPPDPQENQAPLDRPDQKVLLDPKALKALPAHPPPGSRSPTQSPR